MLRTLLTRQCTHHRIAAPPSTVHGCAGSTCLVTPQAVIHQKLLQTSTSLQHPQQHTPGHCHSPGTMVLRKSRRFHHHLCCWLNAVASYGHTLTGAHKRNLITSLCSDSNTHSGSEFLHIFLQWQSLNVVHTHCHCTATHTHMHLKHLSHLQPTLAHPYTSLLLLSNPKRLSTNAAFCQPALRHSLPNPKCRPGQPYCYHRHSNQHQHYSQHVLRNNTSN